VHTERTLKIGKGVAEKRELTIRENKLGQLCIQTSNTKEAVVTRTRKGTRKKGVWLWILLIRQEKSTNSNTDRESDQMIAFPAHTGGIRTEGRHFDRCSKRDWAIQQVGGLGGVGGVLRLSLTT